MVALDELRLQYNQVSSRWKPILQELLEQLEGTLESFSHVDRVYGRVKGKESFLAKVASDPEKYDPPFSQVEDFIGLRVLVTFPATAGAIAAHLNTNFLPNVENYYKMPPNPNQFGYEGHQMIQSLPYSMIDGIDIADFPKVLEIQVKTLFMHAWAEAEHAIRYERTRARQGVPSDVERRLAWIAASSWGSDRILAELVREQGIDSR